MAKQQAIICVDNEDEVVAFERWLERWNHGVTVSENSGCGCCVNIYEVEGPQEALDELPLSVRAAT